MHSQSTQYNNRPTARLKAVSLIFAVVFAAALLFSGIFIITQSQHDCCCEHCEICLQLECCQMMIKTSLIAVGIGLIAAAAGYILATDTVKPDLIAYEISLITLKVKLTN